MDPEEVNPRNFTTSNIIYNDGDFSIAIGIWNEDNTLRFAMRWNGTPTEAGYPNYAGNPMWFQLPENIIEVLGAIRQNSNDGLPSIR